jgi:alkanesulfonate monooxygenase SsuD/methylene tetrahydromethanopterin reductase-like flavin-dependent oxidoreductase (luciferase family)
VRRAVERVRAGAARAGRDPASVKIACYLRVCAGAPPAVMRRALAREIARYIDMPFYRQMFDAAGFAAHTPAVAAAYPRDSEEAAALVADEMLAALTVAGDGGAFAGRVEEYRALGVTLPVVAPVPAGDDLADSWAAAIRLGARTE